MSEKPIYVQLMDSIKKKIQDGQLQVGDRLVSEREMSEQYGINRMTVRNALKKLQEEGVIETKRGSGNYVAKVPCVEEKLELGRAGVYSLSAQIRQKGMKSSRKTLSLTKIKPEDKLKEVFPNEDYVYEIIRLSYINDEPYALQKVYIPCSKFEDAERFDFESFSLYDYMDDLGHRPRTMVSYLRIDSLPTEYRKYMDIERNVFIFDYHGYDENRELVEYTISYHNPKYSSFKYVTQGLKFRSQ